MGKRTRRNPRNETEKTKSEGEAGETREEPRCSGLARRGLRLLLAALRQLGGVRRGIEIANAHYGYFPIEGRIPLSPLARSLTTFLSLFLIPLATSSPPSLASFKFSLSPSLFRSLHAALHSLSLFFFLALSFHLSHHTFLSQLCALSLSSHLFLSSRIASRFSFPLPFFLKSCTLILLSLSFSLPPSFSRKTEVHAEKRRQSLSFPRVPFLSISVTFSLRMWIVFPPRSIAFLRKKPRFWFPFLSSIFRFVSPFVSLFSYLSISCISYPFRPSHIHVNSHSYSRYTHRVTSVISPRPHPITHCEPWLFHRLYAVFTAFIHHPLSPAPACLF